MSVHEPLAGVRVLSLAEQYPGPYATLLLADLGADVIIVERPAGGDPSRRYPGHFEALNRNKRSLALDLKARAGKRVLRRLIESADILIEGFRPGTMGRLGFSADDARAINTRLVYVSISGFGQSGPYEQVPGHDLSYQAVAGALSGQDGDGDSRPRLPVADLSSAMFGALGAVLALLQQRSSGSGSHVDVSMTDGLVSWMGAEVVAQMNGARPAPFPPDGPAYGVFRCSDGSSLVLSIAHEDRFWRSLCEQTGLERFADLGAGERAERRSELRARLAAALVVDTRERWGRRLDAADVPWAPVNELSEVAEDPHVRARNLIGSVGDRSFVRQPLRFDGRASAVTQPVPELGANSREVLTEIGYAHDEIDELVNAGTVVA